MRFKRQPSSSVAARARPYSVGAGEKHCMVSLREASRLMSSAGVDDAAPGPREAREVDLGVDGEVLVRVSAVLSVMAGSVVS